MRDAAEDHAEGGGGLALALAGVDDDQALLAGLGGHDLVAGGLLLGHLRLVAGVLVGGLAHHVFLGFICGLPTAISLAFNFCIRSASRFG